jgi:death-on-curing protein
VVVYLSVEQVDELHRAQIEQYGGHPGTRDAGALEAAVARPTMTFGGQDLYPDVAAKAAALMHSLLARHPYMDGNKRVAVHAALLFLVINGWAWDIDPDNLVEITMAAARGEMDVEPLTIWLRQHAWPPD